MSPVAADCGGYTKPPTSTTPITPGLLRPAICNLICESRPQVATRSLVASDHEDDVAPKNDDASDDITPVDRGWWSFRPKPTTNVVLDKPGVISNPIYVRPGDKPSITIKPQITFGGGLASAGTQMLLSLICLC